MTWKYRPKYSMACSGICNEVVRSSRICSGNWSYAVNSSDTVYEIKKQGTVF